MGLVNAGWSGYRELILIDKINECQDITSFYFKAKDGKSLVPHQPGQFLPFKIQTHDERYKDVLRTYSLSNYPNESIYRISVKKVPGGLISTYLHDNFSIGDTIEAMVPTGLFTLSPEVRQSNRPLILLSGGIGITPLISMLYEQANTDRSIYFIQAVQNSLQHPFKHDVESLAQKSTIHHTVFYANPLSEDTLGKDYNKTGYITKEWLKANIPLDAEFYFCGPPPFMKALEQSLCDLAVPQSHIHYELFSV